MPFKIHVDKRSSASKKDGSGAKSRFPLTLELAQSAPTVGDIKAAIHAQVKKLSPERQRLTTADKKALLDDAQDLTAAGVKPEDTLTVKDLGPQIAWRTVFLTEYFGPLFIHPLIYYFGPQLFRSKFTHSKMQTIALVLVLAHFTKRELETLFVHKFSNGTMPAFNIVKNSFHYWVLSGILLAVGVYGPWASEEALKGTLRSQDGFLYGCVAVWAIGQLSNFYTHIILSNLRPKGTRQRKIPRGFGFELVSCPNYFFETIVWGAFTVMTLSPAALLFSVVATAQMFVWAVKKHRNYRKEFKDYPRGRKAMFPFIA